MPSFEYPLLASRNGTMLHDEMYKLFEASAEYANLWQTSSAIYLRGLGGVGKTALLSSYLFAEQPRPRWLYSGKRYETIDEVSIEKQIRNAIRARKGDEPQSLVETLSEELSDYQAMMEKAKDKPILSIPSLKHREIHPAKQEKPFQEKLPFQKHKKHH